MSLRSSCYRGVVLFAIFINVTFMSRCYFVSSRPMSYISCILLPRHHINCESLGYILPPGIRYSLAQPFLFGAGNFERWTTRQPIHCATTCKIYRCVPKSNSWIFFAVIHCHQSVLLTSLVLELDQLLLVRFIDGQLIMLDPVEPVIRSLVNLLSGWSCIQFKNDWILCSLSW